MKTKRTEYINRRLKSIGLGVRSDYPSRCPICFNTLFSPSLDGETPVFRCMGCGTTFRKFNMLDK